MSSLLWYQDWPNFCIVKWLLQKSKQLKGMDCCKGKMKRLLLLPHPPPSEDRELLLYHAVVQATSLQFWNNSSSLVGPVETGTETTSSSSITTGGITMDAHTHSCKDVDSLQWFGNLTPQCVDNSEDSGQDQCELDGEFLGTDDGSIGVNHMYPYLEEWCWRQ